MNWLDFGVTRSKVKGHRAHYVCKNSSWSRYLKNRLMNACQTLVVYVSCRANELIRFWGHEVKGQRSQGSLCMQKQLVIALSEEPIDGFLPNFGHVCILAEPMNWLDFGVTRSKVKGHSGSLCMQKQLVIALSSRTDWWIPAKLRSCMLSCRADELIRSWGHEVKVKGHGLIMYAKIACGSHYH